MLVRIASNTPVRELAGRLRLAGLEIVITNGGLELRPRARLTIRRWHRRPTGHQATATRITQGESQ